MQWEIIPIPNVLFPFPCLHSRSHGTFSIIPILMGIPRDPWDPAVVPISMHISNSAADVMLPLQSGSGAEARSAEC